MHKKDCAICTKKKMDEKDNKDIKNKDTKKMDENYIMEVNELESFQA